MAFSAFHAAEEKGLLNIQLKDVFEAPLAQRRHHKRSTSSNASSESNISTNSSLSTSNASMNTTTSNTNANYTPTKKCPLSCGKLSEQTIFNFNNRYVTEYLKQQHIQTNNQNLVFNRPITRSITHHNNKLTYEPNLNIPTILPSFTANTSTNYLNNPSHIPNLSQSTNPPVNSLIINTSDNSTSNSTNGNSSPMSLLNPPPKRLKRCSTILID